MASYSLFLVLFGVWSFVCTLQCVACVTRKILKQRTNAFDSEFFPSTGCYTEDKEAMKPKNRPNNSQEKERTCQVVDIAHPTDHRGKLKETEQRDKYRDPARKLEIL